MDLFRRICLALVLGCVIAPTVTRGEPPCPADADAPPERFGASWSDLYAHYLRVGRCDDGAVAEGFSRAVLSLLARAWKELPQLGALAQRDPAFRAFVLRHVDDMEGQGPLRTIRHQAQTGCPAALAALCRDIASRAQDRLESEHGPARTRPQRDRSRNR